MWFITALASKRREHRPRCFGYYMLKSEALDAIKKNYGSMDECLYDYLVLEYIEPGIHSIAESGDQRWFGMSYDGRGWVECERPSQYEGIINFAIG